MATLKQGTTLAKKIRKAHPKMSWINAVKAAHQQLNKGVKKSAVKRKAATVNRSPVKRKVSGVTKSAGSAQHMGSLAGVKSAGLTLLKAKYGKLATQKALARTKTEKRKVGKEMTATLRAIKNVKSI
ncbi:MAG: hypothetical protein [Bacteriophage sp.]|nr:MAG: hypothetical protein [Bacteriophage sp.]